MLRLGRDLFLLKTAKSQPIWIKFCSHLLLYGIHLWADLDRDRRVGSSRPNQNDYVFVILVTHPKYYVYRDDGSPRFRRQTVSGGEDGCYREKFRKFIAWAEPASKNIFRVLGYSLTILRTAYRKQFYPKPMDRWKAETLEVCLLLVWRVYYQAFGRYRPLKGAEKWLRDHHENWKLAYRHT